MKTLSPKQQQIYDYIVSFSGLHGYPPSVREIGAAMGLKSPSTVHFHLKKLADEFDHTLIYESGTLREKTVEALLEEGFRLTKVDFRPTAENFSRYFFDRMCGSGYPVSCATVYETPNNCAVYRRDQ